MNEPILVSKKEAARVLSVSLRTIDNLIAAKELTIRRLGRRCLIPRTTLEAFARRDHSTTATATQKCAHKDCYTMRALGREYCAFHQRFVDDKRLPTASADNLAQQGAAMNSNGDSALWAVCTAGEQEPERLLAQSPVPVVQIQKGQE